MLPEIKKNSKINSTIIKNLLSVGLNPITERKKNLSHSRNMNLKIFTYFACSPVIYLYHNHHCHYFIPDFCRSINCSDPGNTLKLRSQLTMFKMSLSKKQEVPESKSDTDTVTESQKLLAIENDLCTKLNNLKFHPPIMYVYNPLIYARILHEAFVTKYFEHSTKKILFLGMNPGPWGMSQTGIFFGETNFVREWLKISGTVNKPESEHPKRKVMGLDCHRSERSGKRFWAFFKSLCGTPENFFKHSFVHNFCPLAFMNALGKNVTPPEIKEKITATQLNDICNEGLINIIKEFNFEIVISIGQFVEKKARSALKSNGVTNIKVFAIPHPSPRNAKHQSNWEQATFAILQQHNLIKYFHQDPDLRSSDFVTDQNDTK